MIKCGEVVVYRDDISQDPQQVGEVGVVLKAYDDPTGLTRLDIQFQNRQLANISVRHVSRAEETNLWGYCYTQLSDGRICRSFPCHLERAVDSVVEYEDDPRKQRAWAVQIAEVPIVIAGEPPEGWSPNTPPDAFCDLTAAASLSQSVRP